MIPFTKYIAEKFLTYYIEAPGIANIYIACYKDLKNPDNKTLNNNLSKIDPTQLTISLKNNFAYGGSRLAKYLDDKEEAVERAIRSVNFLAIAESHMKHSVINKAIEEGALDKLVNKTNNQVVQYLKAENELQQNIDIGYKLPDDYLDLKIRGARCMILPASREVEEILKDIKNPKFDETAEIIFEKVGNFLNGTEAANKVNITGEIIEQVTLTKGTINLTPDFGRFAKIADILNQFTPQVLCLNANAGGCSGKVAYTVSGILAGWQACTDNNLTSFNPNTTSITFIGSAGALGEVIVEYLREQKFKHVRICDLQYKLDSIIEINREADLDKLDLQGYSHNSNGTYTIITKTGKSIQLNFSDKLVSLIDGGYQVIPKTWQVIKAEDGAYTDEALEETDTILSTAVGREIENSNYQLIKAGTLFLAAHNIAIPLGEAGLKVVKDLKEQGVIFIPGQVLTLGGALTSRLEACHRNEHKIVKADEGKNTAIFPKRLAHEIVKNIIYHITSHIIKQKEITPWEALVNYADLEDLLEIKDEKDDLKLNNKFIPYDIRY